MKCVPIIDLIIQSCIAVLCVVVIRAVRFVWLAETAVSIC